MIIIFSTFKNIYFKNYVMLFHPYYFCHKIHLPFLKEFILIFVPLFLTIGQIRLNLEDKFIFECKIC